MNPARALNDGRGQHAWLAKHLQSDASAHDIHDGIDGADFMKVNFVRRMSVNFSFRHGDAAKHRERFLLYPA